MKTSIDTRAKFLSNIIKFSEDVIEQMLNLKVRERITHDPLVNLWKAYLSISASAFVSYIQ